MAGFSGLGLFAGRRRQCWAALLLALGTAAASPPVWRASPGGWAVVEVYGNDSIVVKVGLRLHPSPPHPPLCGFLSLPVSGSVSDPAQLQFMQL